VAFDGRRFLALAFLRGLLVKLAPTQLGEDPGFLAGSLEAAQCRIEVLAFSYSDARHRLLTNGFDTEKMAGWAG
jgi:hypothetical protein